MYVGRKELVARSARFHGSRAAVVHEGRVLSFDQANERANRLANALAGMGLRPRNRIATLMSNCLQYLEIEFGLVKGSFPQVTLNPRLTPAELLFQINETQARALIFQHRYTDVVQTIRQDLEEVCLICIEGTGEGMLKYEKVLSVASPAEPDGELDPDDIGEIRYTSGTTGTPKGVVLAYSSRLAVTRNLLMDTLGDLTSEDRFLALQPLYHGAGWFILPAWIRGATQFVVPRYDPEIALDVIEKEKITVIKTVPTVLIRLLDSPHIKNRDLSSVRAVVYGGSPMPLERLREAIEVFGPVFINLYGQLEAPMTITWLPKKENNGPRLGSVGRPFTFVQVKVVDAAGIEVGPGETGEIAVRGDHQMMGYLNQPDATTAAVKDGWVRTGDLGTQNQNGYVYLSGGRKSEMIISGGLNVYPAEVERVLNQNPAVAEVGVLGVPDPVWGEAVKACVVLRTDGRATEQELIDFCKERLAGYKIPKSVDFVEELPHTAAGKVAYAELRRRYNAR